MKTIAKPSAPVRKANKTRLKILLHIENPVNFSFHIANSLPTSSKLIQQEPKTISKLMSILSILLKALLAAILSNIFKILFQILISEFLFIILFRFSDPFED